MKRTVSCRFYSTGKLLTNPTPDVTKELNQTKRIGTAGRFLSLLDMVQTGWKKGGKAGGATRQPFKKMEDRMKRCSCLASMSIDKRFYKSSIQLLQKI